MAKTVTMSNWHPQSLDKEDCHEEEGSEYSSDEAGTAEKFEEQKNELSEQLAESNSIVVKVKRIKSGVNDELSMKIDRDVELRWLIIHYCDKVGIVRKLRMNHYNYDIKFMFNGARVRETDTPLRLSMLDNDVIYVFDRVQNYDPQRSCVGYLYFYTTLSIRMHKRRDTLVRVSSTVPLVPQLKRHLFCENAEKFASACFLYEGRRLNEDDSVGMLNMDDGDIVDAFDFEENSSSLRIITPINRHLTLKMVFHDGKVNQVKTMGNTPLAKVQRKYAESIGMKPEKTVLIYRGRQLPMDKTVQEENLFDGCEIDVIMRQP